MNNPYNLNDWQWKMLNLDCALTGKPAKAVADQIRNQAGNLSPEDWLESGAGEWYLSDGGYSRLGFNETTGHLFVTDNSLPRVKEAWGRCSELIADVETLLRAVYTRHGITFTR